VIPDRIRLRKVDTRRVEEPVTRRVAVAFDELALAI
jgi:hypothetical protein